MTIIRRPSANLTLNDMFNSFLEDVPMNWTPRMNVKEDDDSYTIIVETPGLNKEDISIQLEDGILNISGEKKEVVDEKNKRYHFNEIRYGKFTRKIEFPAALEYDKVSANYSNGVLNLVIPKPEKAKPMKIEIH